MQTIAYRTALFMIALFVLTALFGPYVVAHDPLGGSLRARMDPPAWMPGGSWEHVLGTDRLGRDILARLISGARISLAVCAIVIVVSGFIGTTVGTISGYMGGWTDRVLMRIVDLAMALPTIMLALLLAAIIGPSFTNIIIVITFTLWSKYARMARGETLRVKNEDFVDLARTSGLGHLAIIVRHVLPNIAPSLIVIASLQVGIVIVLEASLSFLGVGVPPPNPSWGAMVADGRGNIVSAWWISMFPGIAIMLVAMSVNIVGDHLTDRLNPALRGRNV